ncbi:MAG: glycosyltransferase family 2 protein [Candidatus Poribacteria bacterium]|nr:glycosyltransferase family 2 protein [Candidatus Poribacteria bacterium]
MAIDVSVVIPTYNKKEFLEITLTALKLQTYPIDKYEVVVVNDGSTDQTDDFISSLKVPYQINYTRQENKGRSAARNRGIEQAKGETIIFIDDDCIPAPTFIERHQKFHSESDNFSVIGYRYQTFFKMLPDSSANKGILIEQLKRHKMLHYLKNVPENTALIRPEDILRHGFDKLVQLSYWGERDRWEQVYDTYTSNMNGFVLPWLLFVTSNVSVKKRHLGRHMELFDEKFKGWGLEDFEMGYRLYKRGLRFVLDREAIVYRLMHQLSDEHKIVSKVGNYIKFCQKHPYIEIYLHWRLSTYQLDIHTYNVMVQQYYDLVEKKQVMRDYYQLVKDQCERYGHNLEYRHQKGG